MKLTDCVFPCLFSDVDFMSVIECKNLFNSFCDELDMSFYSVYSISAVELNGISVDLKFIASSKNSRGYSHQSFVISKTIVILSFLYTLTGKRKDSRRDSDLTILQSCIDLLSTALECAYDVYLTELK